jgi:hypothetical protein
MNKLKNLWLQIKSKRVEYWYKIRDLVPAKARAHLPMLCGIAVCVILIRELNFSRNWLELSVTLCVGRWIFPSVEKLFKRLARRL